jgi:hypothetical protein
MARMMILTTTTSVTSSHLPLLIDDDDVLNSGIVEFDTHSTFSYRCTGPLSHSEITQNTEGRIDKACLTACLTIGAASTRMRLPFASDSAWDHQNSFASHSTSIPRCTAPNFVDWNFSVASFNEALVCSTFFSSSRGNFFQECSRLHQVSGQSHHPHWNHPPQPVAQDQFYRSILCKLLYIRWKRL